MTYNVFGGTLSLTQSIKTPSSGVNMEDDMTILGWQLEPPRQEQPQTSYELT